MIGAVQIGAFSGIADVNCDFLLSYKMKYPARGMKVTPKAVDKNDGWQGIMAGATGFEPVNDGVKVRCVTASPHPII